MVVRNNAMKKKQSTPMSSWSLMFSSISNKDFRYGCIIIDTVMAGSAIKIFGFPPSFNKFSIKIFILLTKLLTDILRITSIRYQLLPKYS